MVLFYGFRSSSMPHLRVSVSDDDANFEQRSGKRGTLYHNLSHGQHSSGGWCDESPPPRLRREVGTEMGPYRFGLRKFILCHVIGSQGVFESVKSLTGKKGVV